MTVEALPAAPLVERVDAAARRVRLRMVLLGALAWVLHGCGVLAYRALRGCGRVLSRVLYLAGWSTWHVLRWCGTAVRLGWVDARDAAHARAVEVTADGGGL